MKKALITFVILFLSFFTKAVQIRNLSLDNPALNILYSGIQNILEFEPLNKISNVKIVSGKQGEIFQDRRSNLFYFTPNEIGEDSLIVYDKDSCVFRSKFYVEQLPYPVASLGEIIGKKVKVKDLISKPYITVSYPNCHYICKISAIKFQISIVHEKDTTKAYEPLRPGIFDSITVVDPVTLEERMEVRERIEQIVYNFNEKLSAFQIRKIGELTKNDAILITEIRFYDGFGCGKARSLDDIVINIE